MRAHNSKGYGSYSSSTGTATTNPVTGSSTYTSGGTYTFMKPSGVSTASLVAIGAGSIIGGGGGGGLGYINNASFCGSYSSFTIYVGTPGFYRCGGYGGTWACGLFSGQGNSYQGASGGGNDTNGGYGFAGAQVKHNGGSGSGYGGGGGGAAGYSGNGGHGSACGLSLIHI